jgi:heat shock protein HslJ
VKRRKLAGLLLGVVLAGCATQPVSPAPPSVAASGSAAPASPSGEPTLEPDPFDFVGTAWRAETIDGQALPVGVAPTMEFGVGEGTKSGSAFSGCSSFAFEWMLEAGRAQIRPQAVDLGTCNGIAAQVETAFLARLAAATAYTADGDSLTIAGPAGQIQLRRDAPPIGDPGRAVLELVRTGIWQVVAAPGIRAAARPTGIHFTDRQVFAVDSCGFGGQYRLLPQGGVKFEEIGWDTIGGCDAAHDAARTILKRLLESSTTARVAPDGASVIFGGPNGEIVLGR